MSEKLSREDVAKIEIGNTAISRPLAITAVAVFLVFIMSYPLFQAGYEITNRTGKALPLPQSLEIYPQLLQQSVVANDNSIIEQVIDTNSALLKTINDYEDKLDEQAVLRKYLLSPAQEFILTTLNTGNEKAFIGINGWLFYQSGVSYLTNGGFLNQTILNKRLAEGGVQSDPRLAILQFNEQLAERGIKLIIMPMPIKPMLYPENLTGKKYTLPLHNPSFKSFCQQLTAAGVTVFDPTSIMVEAKKSGMDIFLKADTHWTPQAMQLVTQQLSLFIQQQLKLSPIDNYSITRAPQKIKGQGDIAEMLNIDNVDQLFPRQAVVINEVTVDKNYWRADKNAEILLLGDSFFNIYSLSAMGWGGHAGFSEQLSFYLKQPVDAILRNDAGAYATRQQLTQELKRGHDRLAGKKIVIWEFASRELANGNWKLFDMKLGKPTDSSFVMPELGKPIDIEAIVIDMSSVPRPGSVPYKDHVLSIHLSSLDGTKHYLVYAMSMKDNKMQAVADLRTGEIVKIKLCNWQDVEGKYSGLNRSDLDDEDISLEDPCWGELK